MQINKSHLQKIYTSYCINWRVLQSHLNIDTEFGPQIEEKEKRQLFFIKWYEQMGHNATYYNLIDALLKVGNNEDATHVCLLLREIVPQLEEMDQEGALNTMDMMDSGNCIFELTTHLNM